MKKLLLFALVMLASIQAFSQEWTRTHVDADELKGTEEKIVLMYENNGNIFQVDYKEEKMFFLKTSKSFFNFTTSKGASHRFTVDGIVGLYDKDGKLIEKIEMCFEVYDPATICYPNKYTKMGGNNYKRSKKIIDYLKQSKGEGYVRFVLPLHGITTDFDFKVPTIKSYIPYL